MYKVFLVDDEIVIREGIRNSFPWEGNGGSEFALVGEAPDGEIALQMMQDVKPDILITDIRMPFMDGMQLCEAVSHTMPWVQIVILSGYDDFSYAQQAISLGVKEYLLKPVSAQELWRCWNASPPAFARNAASRRIYCASSVSLLPARPFCVSGCWARRLPACKGRKAYRACWNAPGR